MGAVERPYFGLRDGRVGFRWNGETIADSEETDLSTPVLVAGRGDGTSVSARVNRQEKLSEAEVDEINVGLHAYVGSVGGSYHWPLRLYSLAIYEDDLDDLGTADTENWIDAQRTLFPVSTDLDAAGGNRRDVFYEDLASESILAVTASRAPNAQVSLISGVTISALVSRPTPETELSATATLYAKSNAVRDAQTSLTPQPNLIALGGYLREVDAGLAAEAATSAATIVKRSGKAFLTGTATAEPSAHAIRRFLFWFQNSVFTFESDLSVAHSMIRARRSKVLSSKALMAGAAVAIRDAKAWLPSHKARVRTKAMRSPSAALRGAALIKRVWRNAIRRPSAGLGGELGLSVSVGIGLAPQHLSVASTLDVGAVRAGTAEATLQPAASLDGSITLVEGPKPTLAANSAVSVEASAAYPASATLEIGALAEADALGPVKFVAASVSGNSGLSPQATVVEGPKPVLAAHYELVVEATYVEGPKPTLAATASLTVSVIHRKVAMAHISGKGVIHAKPSFKRRVRMWPFPAKATVSAFAGVIKPCSANLSGGARVACGWGAEVDLAQIEITVPLVNTTVTVVEMTQK